MVCTTTKNVNNLLILIVFCLWNTSTCSPSMLTEREGTYASVSEIGLIIKCTGKEIKRGGKS